MSDSDLVDVQLTVHQEIFHRFPGIRIAVVVARGVDNTVARARVNAFWHEAWAGVAEAIAPYGNAQSHPNIVPWREAFRANGVSPKAFPSSVEALVRRAAKGGTPFVINPLVDFYNAVSLRHIAPAGAFDLDALDGRNIEVRSTRTGDSFLALDADESIVMPEGETAYASGTTVLTRHLMWRQARQALIAPATRHLVFMSEIIGPEIDTRVDGMLWSLRNGLHEYFGVDATGQILDIAAPTAHLT